MKVRNRPWNALQKIGLFTAFSIGLLVVSIGVEFLSSGLFFQTDELVFSVLICWFFDVLSILWVERARGRSEQDFAGVWVGALPRLGGPMTTIAALTLLADPGTCERLIACLVFVYLVSLPVAVWLTLPGANRTTERSPSVTESESESGVSIPKP